MHSTNSNEVLSLHTQNALNQLKSSAPFTHSECIQPIEIKGSPYTLRMHSANSNEVLSLHTHNALNDLKSGLTMLECGHMHDASKYLQRAPIQPLCTSKLEMASKVF